MAEERGYWNRAGRRSGGDRPMKPTGLLTEQEHERLDLIRGIRERRPLSLIVGQFLRYEDGEIEREMQKAGVCR